MGTRDRGLLVVGGSGGERGDVGLARWAQVACRVDGGEALEVASDRAVCGACGGVADTEGLGDLLVPERLLSAAEVLHAQRALLAFAEGGGELARQRQPFGLLDGGGRIARRR